MRSFFFSNLCDNDNQKTYYCIIRKYKYIIIDIYIYNYYKIATKMKN